MSKKWAVHVHVTKSCRNIVCFPPQLKEEVEGQKGSCGSVVCQQTLDFESSRPALTVHVTHVYKKHILWFNADNVDTPKSVINNAWRDKTPLSASEDSQITNLAQKLLFKSKDANFHSRFRLIFPCFHKSNGVWMRKIHEESALSILFLIFFLSSQLAC